MLNERKEYFQSPTFGILNIDQLIERMLAFVAAETDRDYKLIIGTDSHARNGSGVDFVTAIIVHRVGSGGIYFWQKSNGIKKQALPVRIFEEATRSLTCAQRLNEVLDSASALRASLEIHVDIGTRGPTRELIKQVVGMVKGSGFEVKIKPESWGASKVADRHT